MHRWTTEFSVVARHYPKAPFAPTLADGYCVLAMEGDAMMLVCQTPDGALHSHDCRPEHIPGLLLLHDTVVPRLHVVEPQPPEPDVDLCSRMMMFNAQRNRLRALR